jgi:hypothetical protein
MAKIVSTGKALHSPEYHVKNEKARRMRVWWWLLLVVLILVTPILVLRNERLLIRNIEVFGTSGIKESDIEQSVLRALEGKYLWLIPKKSVLLYPRDDISGQLRQDIPRVVSADIRLMDLGTLSVSVVERSPLALYCPEPHLAILSNCYFIDQEGLLFSQAPAFSGDVYFIYTGPLLVDDLTTETREYLGHRFMAPEHLSAIVEFIESVERMGTRPRIFEIDKEIGENGKYTLTLSGGGQIIWNGYQSLQLIRSNLETFMLSDLVVSNPQFLSEVAYIDLSVDNKVFYKLK